MIINTLAIIYFTYRWLQRKETNLNLQKYRFSFLFVASNGISIILFRKFVFPLHSIDYVFIENGYRLLKSYIVILRELQNENKMK